MRLKTPQEKSAWMFVRAMVVSIRFGWIVKAKGNRRSDNILIRCRGPEAAVSTRETNKTIGRGRNNIRLSKRNMDDKTIFLWECISGVFRVFPQLRISGKYSVYNLLQQKNLLIIWQSAARIWTKICIRWMFLYISLNKQFQIFISI